MNARLGLMNGKPAMLTLRIDLKSKLMSTTALQWIALARSFELAKLAHMCSARKPRGCLLGTVFPPMLKPYSPIQLVLINS